MNLFQTHYLNVVQPDLILTENLLTVSNITAPKKVTLSLGGDNAQKPQVVKALSVLKLISYQQPYLTFKSSGSSRLNQSSEVVGGKVTLRKSNIFNLWEKLLFEVLPSIKQFEGFHPPLNHRVYSFVLKDVFAFQELIPLFTFFEGIKNIQFQIHFKNSNKTGILALSSGLQFCFLANQVK